LRLGRGEIDAVLFDLDGTLMDTDDQAVESIARWLRRWHIPHPDGMARRFIMATEPVGSVLIASVDSLGLDKVLFGFAAQVRRFRGLRDETHFRIMPGVEAVVKHLSKDYKLGVVTTRSRPEAEAFLDQFGLASCFQTVVTRETTWRLKPHPAPLQFAARALRAQPERCIMVGDSTVDMKAGRRARMIGVGVLCGFGERSQLEKSGARLVVERTAQIAEILQ